MFGIDGHHARAAFVGTGALLLAVVQPSAQTSEPSATMEPAVRYLEVMAGRDLSLDDKAWLMATWTRHHADMPDVMAERLDDLALGLELYQEQRDPIRLATDRAALVKDAYCAAEQSSDPEAGRLRAIIAPDDLVLAADCAYGLVVTPADIDGLVASRALAAAETGQAHDPQADHGAVSVLIHEAFDDAAPVEKAVLANGELRHAVLARFWSQIEGSPEQDAVVQALREKASADLGSLARQLEDLALAKLDQVDFLAKVGDAALTADMVADYVTWLERIAGYSLTSRDRAWLQQAIADSFETDPQTILDQLAGIDQMNQTYHLADTDREKDAIVATWAARLHCSLSRSEGGDEDRLAEVVFRENPVTHADCDAGRIARDSETTIAEADGQMLTQQQLDTGLDFLEMLLGRPLSVDEKAMIKDDSIREFTADPEGWQAEEAQLREMVARLDRDGARFLIMDTRNQLFDPVYCALTQPSEPMADAYEAIFQKGRDILFDDCERQIVTTQNEIDAVVGSLNFLALLNGQPPLSSAQIETIAADLKGKDLSSAEGTFVALMEWWAMLTLDEKRERIDWIRKNGITPQSSDGGWNEFVNIAKTQVVSRRAMRDQCQLMAITIRGYTDIYAAESGREFLNDSIDVAGFSGSGYAVLASTTGMMSAFCS